jgi:hypothetical protein
MTMRSKMFALMASSALYSASSLLRFRQGHSGRVDALEFQEGVCHGIFYIDEEAGEIWVHLLHINDGFEKKSRLAGGFESMDESETATRQTADTGVPPIDSRESCCEGGEVSNFIGRHDDIGMILFFELLVHFGKKFAHFFESFRHSFLLIYDWFVVTTYMITTTHEYR